MQQIDEVVSGWLSGDEGLDNPATSRCANGWCAQRNGIRRAAGWMPSILWRASFQPSRNTAASWAAWRAMPSRRA